MAEYWFELSQENPALAEAEAEAVVVTTGGVRLASAQGHVGFLAAEFRDVASAELAAARIASARRMLGMWPLSTHDELLDRFRELGRTRTTASFRTVGRGTTAPLPDVIRAMAGAFIEGGGAIDLEHPVRRFWIANPGGDWNVGEEIGQVDRRSFEARRMPTLPFQRPVSLPPRLGRIAVNLAHVKPGMHVVDPFVGTGALLAEAALLGARVTGVDRDARMVRGASENFAHLGVEAEQWIVDDARSAGLAARPGSYDALVTDPPYGRASSVGDETPAELLARTMPAWGDAVGPEGRIVLVVAGGPDPLPRPWRRELCVVDRVHRSLTREFRVYRRSP
jgi:tRNA (guanine10-N2)-dimethyltransferase